MSIITRTSQETRIEVSVAIGGGQSLIETPLPFLNHMLTTLARYGALGLQVRASGDLKHHIIEDTAITIGTALRQAVPDTARRFGESTVPMDDALVQAVLDVGGRPYYQGPLPSRLYDHFFRSLAMAADYTLHLRVLR